MLNLDILRKKSKSEIYENLLNMSLGVPDYYEYETVANHILWLFEEMNETVKFFFFKEEFMKDLPFQEGEEENDELAKDQRNEYPGHDAFMPKS